MKNIHINRQAPKDGLAGLKENWKTDLTSGFLVFLIALPLCLGIAMASGFPPIGGILTAIIGGLVVSPLMGSRLSIKGPAAGLIAIAVAAVADLGQGDAALGYKLTLAVVVVAGLIQVAFALLKLGRFVDFFPTSAVHGMLAAIGIIIIAKQVPVMLGATPESKNPIALLMEIPAMLGRLNPEIAFIGGLSLLILFGLPLIKISWVKKIPAPMLVLLVAIPLGSLFDLTHEHKYLFLDHDYIVGPKFLVTLPGNFLDGITFPDFSQVFSLTSFKYIIMFALVGSLESLLTVKAIDGLDPYKRKSDTNRDLLAVGAGNTLAGLVGGLPMIAEVVRSSANVGNGAKTRWANFFHGGFLLIFVAFFPNLIHQIPLSALAAMLIFTGFRLASPKLFKDTFRIGKEQLAVFLATIIVTLAEDLLVGIAAGIVLEAAIYLFSGVSFKNLFKSNFLQERVGNSIYLKAKNAAVFTNYLGFKKQIEAVPAGQDIVLDFTQADLVDHTFMEQIHHFKHDYEARGGSVHLMGLDRLTPVSSHALSARKATRKTVTA
ncbi:SulP family inorganic anion transporter [Cesiribacter sp. SM1]|uniref:SulP family inorganic anion transporter n=1 Tax=Cesiribacter sp. SM1 TaxID=2861196 RepID=UPI001CD7A448|nr:SulP family inorganic anion transporter [Cesiribacter sp. SM1]